MMLYNERFITCGIYFHINVLERQYILYVIQTPINLNIIIIVFRKKNTLSSKVYNLLIVNHKYIVYMYTCARFNYHTII